MIRTYKPEIDKLIKDTITDLSYRGITPLFSLTDYVEGNNVKSNGFFDSEGREFACALGKPEHLWLRTFVHESCHFDQWKEQCDIWREYDKLDQDEDLLWDWIDKKWDTFNPNDLGDATVWYRLRHVAEVTRELERDCEMRVIKKVQEYGLPIPIEDYARQGWAYVTFYDYILECRKWYVIGKEPYNNEELKALMPSTLYNPGRRSILTDEMRALYANCV